MSLKCIFELVGDIYIGSSCATLLCQTLARICFQFIHYLIVSSLFLVSLQPLDLYQFSTNFLSFEINISLYLPSICSDQVTESNRSSGETSAMLCPTSLLQLQSLLRYCSWRIHYERYPMGTNCQLLSMQVQHSLAVNDSQ